MTPLTRAWLRRIALGLPLVAITPLAGCLSTGASSCDGFDPMERTERWPITAELAATLAVSGADASVDGRTCDELCNELDPGPSLHDVRTCRIVGAENAELLLECDHGRICRGRPVAGLLAPRDASSSGAIGAFLADAAHLERASVPAFLELGRELALHGAPRAMIAAARRAAGDEVRHARAMGSLAARFGARPATVERLATEPRSLRAMAEDNAVHGCVGEAHAALVAAFQAEHASEPAMRAIWSDIAREEAQHALLSLALHDWARAQLDARSARRVEDARHDAIAGLAASVAREQPSVVREALALPDAERAVELGLALA